MRLLLAILLLLIAAPVAAQQSQGMSKAMVVSSCGGGTLPGGALNQLTMDTTGRLCQSGIGSNVCSQATAYLARTTGGNEGGNAVNITALICGLVTDGVWGNLDALYVLAQQNAADALLNLIGTSYGLTNVGGNTFTAYKGYSGFDTTGGQLTTGFNPSTAPTPKFVQDVANFGFWSYANDSVGQPAIGDTYPSNQINNNYLGTSYIRVNTLSGPALPNPGTNGLYVGDRSSSASSVYYWDGVSQGAVTSPSTATSTPFVIGNLGGGGVQLTVSEAHIGASLGSAGNLALYTRLRTYMTAVGVP